MQQEKHWDNFKSQDPGLPLKTLIANINRIKRESNMPAVWQKILAPSPEKNTKFIQRQVAVFTHNLQEAVAQSKGKDINMRMRAPKLRDSVTEAYDIGACWVHFAGDFENKLGKPLFQRAEQSFLRGSYDREFVEKVKTQDPAITVNDFRFLAVLQGTSTTIRSLQQVEEEATEAAEVAQLKLFQSALLKETKVFEEYLAKLQAFNARRAADQRAWLLDENEKFQAAAKQYMDSHVPISCSEKKGYVSTLFQTNLTKYALAQQCTEDSVYSCFFADLTKLGAAFSKYLLDVIRVLSENIAAFPKTSVGILMAPNSGVWGSTYSESDIEKAIQQVETELKDASAHLTVRRFHIMFAEGSFATQSRRCGFLE